MKISRWHLCVEPTFYHRCRGCGAKMKLSLGGWIASFAVIALAVGCYFLYRGHFISQPVLLTLIAVQFVSAIWLAPYFLPVKLVSGHVKADLPERSRDA